MRVCVHVCVIVVVCVYVSASVSDHSHVRLYTTENDRNMYKLFPPHLHPLSQLRLSVSFELPTNSPGLRLAARMTLSAAATDENLTKAMPLSLTARNDDTSPAAVAAAGMSHNEGMVRRKKLEPQGSRGVE